MADTDNPNGWGWRDSANGDVFTYRHKGNTVASIMRVFTDSPLWFGSFMGATHIEDNDFTVVFKLIQTKLIEYGY